MKSARYERSTIRTREEGGDTEGPIVDPRLSCVDLVIHVTKARRLPIKPCTADLHRQPSRRVLVTYQFAC